MRTPFALAVLTCLAVFGQAKAAQDQQQYQRAISDNSTSPYFVLVTINDGVSGNAFTGCVSANFLKGAIFRQLGGDWGPPEDAERRQAALATMRKADEIALRSIDHEFHFSKQAALDDVRLQYTEDDLTEARQAVKSLGLKAMAMGSNTPERKSLGKLQRSAALACAIIEAGGLARRADITSEVYAE